MVGTAVVGVSVVGAIVDGAVVTVFAKRIQVCAHPLTSLHVCTHVCVHNHVHGNMRLHSCASRLDVPIYSVCIMLSMMYAYTCIDKTYKYSSYVMIRVQWSGIIAVVVVVVIVSIGHDGCYKDQCNHDYNSRCSVRYHGR